MVKHELDDKRVVADTLKELIELLKLFPETYKAFAYEAEVCGLRIEDENGEEVDFIRC